MSGIMSISGAKEAERERLNREIEAFKANGGKIKKVPTHSEGYGYQNFRESKKRLESKHKPQPSTFSPRQEASEQRKLAEQKRTYFKKKREAAKAGVPFDETPPWES